MMYQATIVFFSDEPLTDDEVRAIGDELDELKRTVGLLEIGVTVNVHGLVEEQTVA